jgi:hypothetical protein
MAHNANPGTQLDAAGAEVSRHAIAAGIPGSHANLSQARKRAVTTYRAIMALAAWVAS